MKTQKLSGFLFLILLSTLVASCSKEEVVAETPANNTGNNTTVDTSAIGVDTIQVGSTMLTYVSGSYTFGTLSYKPDKGTFTTGLNFASGDKGTTVALVSETGDATGKQLTLTIIDANYKQAGYIISGTYKGMAGGGLVTPQTGKVMLVAQQDNAGANEGGWNCNENSGFVKVSVNKSTGQIKFSFTNFKLRHSETAVEQSINGSFIVKKS